MKFGKNRYNGNAGGVERFVPGSVSLNLSPNKQASLVDNHHTFQSELAFASGRLTSCVITTLL